MSFARRAILPALLLLAATAARAQTTVHQLAGLVLDSATGAPVPLVHVYVPGSARGAVSHAGGFYSLVVRAGDTVRFSAVGYMTQARGVPDTLDGIRHTLTVMLEPANIELEPAYVHPWPNPAAFRRAFIELDQVDPGDRIAPYAGFRCVDNPVEPPPTIMNPASLFYEKVIVAIQKKKRKRKKSKQLPRME